MYAVVREYSGSGARELVELLTQRRSDVEALIRGISGVASYTLIRTDAGCTSVTVCQDKAGTDESIRVAADWIRENSTVSSNPPRVSEGETIVQF